MNAMEKLAMARALGGAGRLAAKGAVGAGLFMGGRHVYNNYIKPNPAYKEFFQALPQTHQMLGGNTLPQMGQQRLDDLENIYTNGRVTNAPTFRPGQ